MAKRPRNASATSSTADHAPANGLTTEDRLGDFAEDLGRFLGSTQAKASAWLDQRNKLLESLVKVRDTAAHYIEQLGGATSEARRPGRPRVASPVKAPGRPKGARKKRTMSAEARAKIAAAQRARWARQRKAKD